jgi:long-chain acyl-CoA synthetase
MNNPDFQARLLRAGADARRRHGGAAAGRRALAEDDGLPDHRGLRPVGDLAGRHRQPVRQGTEFTGTIGLPLPRPRSRSATTTATTLPLGEVGEICIRGPQVMAGYWNRPDETAKVMTPDGFFRSGDIGFMDERTAIKIVDRKKDMILVSGFNVYPNEVEECGDLASRRARMRRRSACRTSIPARR